MPNTDVTAMVKPEVAQRIYANYLKGYIGFKPWTGQGGCSWFGFDGTPYAGSLDGRTIKVVASVDIPANVPTLSKEGLLAPYRDQGGIVRPNRTQDDRATERRMWDDVSNQALAAPGGLLVVNVGESFFSSAAGKFLLVTNAGMKAIVLSDLRAQAIAAQLEDKAIKEITDKINAKDIPDNRTIAFTWRAKKDAKFDGKKVTFKAWIDAECSSLTFTYSEQNSGQFRMMTYKTTFVKYSIAKQNARVLFPKFILFRQTNAGADIGMVYGAVKYELLDSPKPWDYKTNKIGTPPTGVSLLRPSSP